MPKENLRFAAVGASPKGSLVDASIVSQVAHWVKKHRPALRFDKIDWDIINLAKNGRDFLKESKTYDMVALFSLMHTNILDDGSAHRVKTEEELIHLAGAHWRNQVSEQHTLENWRTRLVNTQADYIFVARVIQCSLEAWHLGELPGYVRKFPTPSFGVYYRK